MSACDDGDFPRGPVAWRLVMDEARPGYENMEIDEAALAAQKDPSALPVLRLFRWNARTLSFGRLQDQHEAANQTMILGARSMVRRPTGGGTVIHDGDVSFSLAWRRDHPAFPHCLKNIYRGIHETARRALARLEVAATLHAGAAPAAPMCFEAPAEADVMVGGKKVLGGALRVTAWGRLYQGDLKLKAAGVQELSALGALRGAFEREFFQGPPTA
jgi:lipoate-protein ligase A